MVQSKEYRIVLPFTVDEYRIAQLYMVAKTSRAETKHGEGVEVLKNEPYEDEKHGKGQFTHKIIHVGKRLPKWIKAFIPSSALQIHEKSWNHYPYVRAEYTCPFLGERFSIKMETRYLNDNGKTENCLNIEAGAYAKIEKDVVDIVTDEAWAGELAKLPVEQDPRKFKSQKTGRGPLAPGWRETTQPIMTCYKLCHVEFQMWGVASRVESFVHHHALRNVFLKGHRDVFCWLDEWYGMTIEDVRKYEDETKAALAQQLKEGAAHAAANPEPEQPEQEDAAAVQAMTDAYA
eukprot:tig00000339_g24177.t1